MGSDTQSHPGLHNKSEPSLSYYMRPCLQKEVLFCFLNFSMFDFSPSQPRDLKHSSSKTEESNRDQAHLHVGGGEGREGCSLPPGFMSLHVGTSNPPHAYCLLRPPCCSPPLCLITIRPALSFIPSIPCCLAPHTPLPRPFLNTP